MYIYMYIYIYIYIFIYQSWALMFMHCAAQAYIHLTLDCTWLLLCRKSLHAWCYSRLYTAICASRSSRRRMMMLLRRREGPGCVDYGSNSGLHMKAWPQLLKLSIVISLGALFFNSRSSSSNSIWGSRRATAKPADYSYHTSGCMSAAL